MFLKEYSYYLSFPSHVNNKFCQFTNIPISSPSRRLYKPEAKTQYSLCSSPLNLGVVMHWTYKSSVQLGEG